MREGLDAWSIYVGARYCVGVGVAGSYDVPGKHDTPARKSAILRSVGFVPNQYVKSSVDEVVGEGKTGRRNFFK